MRSASNRPGLEERWQRDVAEFATAAGFLFDDSAVAVGTAAGQVWLLDRETGEVRARFGAHAGGVLCLTMHPTLPLFASGGPDGIVRFWDERGTLRSAHDTGASWIDGLAFSPRGDRLAAAAGRKLQFLDTEGALRGVGSARRSTVSDLAWTASSDALWTAELGGVHAFDPEDASRISGFACPGSLLTVVVAPNGHRVACAGQDGTIRHFRTTDGSGGTLRGSWRKAVSLTWNHRGDLLAHGGSLDVVVWEFAHDESEEALPEPRPHLLQAHQGRISAASFATADDRLASGAADGSLALWNTGPLERIGFALFDGPIHRVAWSHAGTDLLVTTGNGTVRAVRTPLPAKESSTDERSDGRSRRATPESTRSASTARNLGG